MKILVAYSGGKDSQACLIWAVKQYGTKNIEAVFCDTGWEHPATYKHIADTTKQLGVKLITVKSKKYDGMIDLAEKKKRFPSSQARFCTSELKSIPFIDYVLAQTEHLIIIQGIRALESHNRSLMQKQCRYFKYYFEPYNNKGKKHTYRKNDVTKWTERYSDDILRPVFDLTGQQVIDYIKENRQAPNKLYKEGFKRVGCFPCIMSGHKEVHEIIKRYPDRFDEISQHEKKIGSSFFKIDFVPAYAQSGICSRTGKKYTTAKDVKQYLNDKNATLNLFKEYEIISCSSYYNLCE
jgi:3'-phosphoadenosine 5'-phosphosulfate sulfotransferase (PAPS reductase)/FAD synthetase